MAWSLKRQPEQQIQRGGGPDHPGEIGGDDGHLRREPQGNGGGLAEVVPARLGQIAPGGDAQPGRQDLQLDGACS